MNRLIKIASEWLSKFDYWRPRKTLAEDYQNVNGFSKHGVLQFLFLSRSSIEWAYFEMLMKKPTVIKMLNAQEISCNEYRESKAKKKNTHYLISLNFGIISSAASSSISFACIAIQTVDNHQKRFEMHGAQQIEIDFATARMRECRFRQMPSQWRDPTWDLSISLILLKDQRGKRDGERDREKKWLSGG